jgi:hypothetical protein
MITFLILLVCVPATIGAIIGESGFWPTMAALGVLGFLLTAGFIVVKILA